MEPPSPGIARGLALLPFAILVGCVWAWGVDLPFWDQWQLVPLIEKLLAGRLEMADVWRQQNDHRIFFPRLLMLALAALTRWNIRWELAMNVALASGFFLLVTHWLSRSLPAGRASWLVAPAVSLLVFNLNQWENWTWGLQMVVFVNVLAVAGGLWVLDQGGGRPRFLLAGAALGCVATCSFSNGLLFWPLSIPLVLKPAGRRGWRLLVWLLVAAAVMALFFYRYSFDPGAGRLALSVAELPLAAAYVAVFLGAPVFAYDGKLAAAGGLVACGVFLVLTLHLARDRRRLFESALPWILFAGYGIGSGAVAALGRMKLGLDLAMSSRYVVFANFFWLGLLGLILVLPAAHGVRSSRGLLGLAVSAVVVSSLVAGSLWGGVLIHQQYLDRTRVRQALLEKRFHQDLPLTVPNNEIPRLELEVLERHRLSLFRRP